MKDRSAFTLIETIIVLSVIGILLLCSIPALSNFMGGLSLKAVAREMVSDLRFSQERALALKTEVAVEVRGKSLYGDPAMYIIRKTSLIDKKSVNLKTVKLRREFDMRSNSLIRFSSTGSPPPGGSGTVVIEDLGGRVRKIVVSSAGRIRME